MLNITIITLHYSHLDSAIMVPCRSEEDYEDVCTRCQDLSVEHQTHLYQEYLRDQSSNLLVVLQGNLILIIININKYHKEVLKRKSDIKLLQLLTLV